MKGSFFVISMVYITVLASQLVRASDSTEESHIPLEQRAYYQCKCNEKFALSKIDIKLFYAPSTDKILTPYSTASVNSFSKQQKVTLQYKIYSALIENGLLRTERRMNNLDTRIHNLATELDESEGLDVAQILSKHKHIKKLENSSHYAVEQHALFNKFAITSLNNNHDEIKISERSLMCLLQWTYGFERIATDCRLIDERSRRNKYDIVIKLSLDGTKKVYATNDLKAFINQANIHEQNTILKL